MDIGARGRQFEFVLDGPVHLPAGLGFGIGLEILQQCVVAVFFSRRQCQAFGFYGAKVTVEKPRVIASAHDAENIDHVGILRGNIHHPNRTLELPRAFEIAKDQIETGIGHAVDHDAGDAINDQLHPAFFADAGELVALAGDDHRRAFPGRHIVDNDFRFLVAIGAEPAKTYRCRSALQWTR